MALVTRQVVAELLVAASMRLTAGGSTASDDATDLYKKLLKTRRIRIR